MPDPVDLRSCGADFARNPYPYYRTLRERGPVHRALLPDGREVWLVLGHDAVRAALTHSGLAKDWSASTPQWRERQVGDPAATAPLFGRHMLVADPPDHARLRRPAAKAFTSRRLESLRPRIVQITEGLLDDMGHTGSADLVESFAYPLSLAVICEVLGIPAADQDHFRRHSREIVCPTGKAAYLAASHALLDYLHDLIDRKRARPGRDLLSALVQASDSDRGRMSEDELCATTFVLLVAGHETTVNLIGNGVFALLRHPDQLAALRADHSLVDGTVEEMLRYDGPAEATTRRFAAERVEIGECVIPGDRSEVVMVLASANHDPACFPAPERFDIRRDAAGHLAFGHGIHYCLGATLARMEGQIALRSLLTRHPDLVLDADPGELAWRPGCPIRGIERLPIRYQSHLGGG